MDETSLYHYVSGTKQQSIDWRHSGSPSPASKNFECKYPLEKFSPQFFLGQDSILLIDNFPNGQTINVEYYSSLLVQLNISKEERRAWEGHQVGLVLARQCPGSPSTCNPE
jgi:hypothetical protein